MCIRDGLTYAAFLLRRGTGGVGEGCLGHANGFQTPHAGPLKSHCVRAILYYEHQTKVWGRGPSRAREKNVFMHALRCILSSTWDENGPFKSHRFGAILFCEHQT